MKKVTVKKYTPPLIWRFLVCSTAMHFAQSFFAVFILFSTLNAFAAVSANVTQENVYEGDPVTLVIESSQNIAAPDLSSLQKDFTILGTSTSSQINILNGQRSFKKTWTIELQPKRLGKLEIPPIQVGNDKSEKLTVNVTKLPPEVKAETSKHIIIESSVDGTDENQSIETYVQQQIPYTIKLLYDSAMISGEISPQNIENAVIEQLGNDRRYQVTKGGKKFNVVEKRFVISPEKSGTLIIPPTIVSGRIALSGGDATSLRRRMDSTDMLNQFFNDFSNDPFFDNDFLTRRSRGGPSKPFTIRSKEIKVNVLPVPAAFTGKAWLPAEELVIQDSWSKNPPDLKVGEPVSRTLVLQAKGLAGSQIPQIDIPKPDGIKIYPEPPESETRTDGKTVYGIQQMKVSYIPNKSGTVTIPEIKVDWWNVKTKKQETFTLPKWVLNVAPGAAGEESIEPETESAQTTTEVNKTRQADNNGPINNNDKKNSYNWKLIILSLAAAAIFGFLFYRFIAPLLSHERKEKNKQVDILSIKNQLLNACKKNDKHTAARLLIKLAQAQWGDSSIQNLNTLAKKLNTGAEVITELEQNLYSPSSSQWSGQKLHDLVNKGLLQKDNKPNNDKSETLKPLYPI